MATDLEKLVVQLSADIKQYQRGMQDAMGVTNKQARAIEARWRQANKNLDGIGRGMAQSLFAPLAGIGAAIGTREIMSYADAWTRAGNLVAAAGQVAGRSGRSLEGINQIAQDTRGGFSETAELYARILRSTAGVADSEKEVASATEIVNKAFKAGGAGASEMAAGILQLSQGLSSGVLQGDELRSVRENAPLLAQAIADYFGVTVAGMKKLGEEGKLTSDKVFKAILASKGKIDAAFNATSQTIEDAVTRVNNAFMQYIGQSDQGLGASGRLTAGLNALADNFDRVADVTLKVASIIAAALVGRSIAGMIAKLGIATNAVTAFVAALRTASIATAIGGIGAAAGPLGLLIGGTVATALALYYSRTQDATIGSKEYAAALKQVENAAKAAAPAVKAVGEGGSSDAGFAGAYKKAADDLGAAIDPILRKLEAFTTAWVGNDAVVAQFNKIQKLVEEVGKGEAPVSRLKAAIEELGRVNGFAQIAAELNALIGGIDSAAIKFDKLSKQLKLNQLEKQFAPFQAEAQYDENQRKIAKAAKDYIDDATRRNKLTKDQLELEKEIAQVKKDASGKGVQLTDAQAKQVAQTNIAGNDRRSAEGKKVARTADSRFDQDIQAVKDRTAALIEEQKIIGLDTEKQEARRLALDLQQSALKRLREEARQKGVTDLDSIKLSDEQRAKIEAVAAAYGKQYAELEKLNGPLATFARQSADVGKALDASLANSLDRMADDLADVVLQTKSVGDAFKAMTDLILKEIIKIALKKAILGPIAGLLSGGIGSVGKVLGFDEGGPTPAGPKTRAVGVVHAGENVWSQEDVRRAGGMHVVEAMRRGARGYAVGGPVSAPSIPRISPSSGSAQKSTINIVDNIGVKVQAREVVDGRGNRDITVQLDEAVAASLSRPGSASRGALRNNFGARPVGVRR